MTIPTKFKLTKYEQETIILWNEAEPTVSITTFDQKLIKKLNKAKEKAPELYSVSSPDKYGAVEAEVPKNFLRITLATPLSDETREKFSRLAKERFHS